MTADARIALCAVVLAAGIGGCGGGAHPTAASNPQDTGTVQVTSSTCSVGQNSAVQCVFVLSDGRRFRCPGSLFGGEAVAAGMLMRSRQCGAIKPLHVPAGVRAITARIHVARRCLARRGLRATGGPVFPAPENGYRGPGGELVIPPVSRTSVGGMSFIAFYADASTARRLEPRVIANTRRLDAEIERRGAVTILMIRPIAPGRRSAVRACAFAS